VKEISKILSRILRIPWINLSVKIEPGELINDSAQEPK
jgi:hypothetical protein